MGNGEQEIMIVRKIAQADIPRCTEIYNYYIENTTVTFEERPLTEEEFFARVCQISKEYPYFVAEECGEVIGYAYLDKYNERSAYRYTADFSVYLDKSQTAKGTGGLLLAETEKAALDCGIVNILSLITEENFASVAFHRKHGFELTGVLKKVGFKQNKWLDVLFYQKCIGQKIR